MARLTTGMTPAEIEAELLQEAAHLMARIRRQTRREFADRCEEYMRRNKLLPRDRSLEQ